MLLWERNVLFSLAGVGGCVHACCWAGGQKFQICLQGHLCCTMWHCGLAVPGFPMQKTVINSCFLLQSSLRWAWKVLDGSSLYFCKNCVIQCFFPLLLLLPPSPLDLILFSCPDQAFYSCGFGKLNECQFLLEDDLLWDLYMNLVMLYCMVNTHLQ